LLTALKGFDLGSSYLTAERLEPVLEGLAKSKEQLPADDKPAVEVMEYLVGPSVIYACGYRTRSWGKQARRGI
jgi:hypothetical protein